MFRDWCPLCGARFQGETPEEVIEQIIQHTEDGEDGKNECERNFKPLSVALKDDHY